MNINELIKKSHENAIEKGFYDCPECGCSTDDLKLLHMCQDGEHCETSCEDCEVSVEDFCCNECKDTGIDQNKNIPELLMLVITEISEAVEALRKNKILNNNESLSLYIFSIEKYGSNETATSLFERDIKDTFEDEIADVFIRLFDLCGYLGIEIDEIESKNIRGFENNNSENLFNIVSMITELSNTFLIFENQDIELIKEIFNQLLYFCEHNNIDIEKHITAKMQYNSTRPKKHGKEF